MKTAFLLSLFCFFPLLVFAQYDTNKTYQPQPSYQAQPAPVPGHPLNPADVAVLTGHSSAKTAYSNVTPVITYGDGYGNNPWFGRRQTFGFQGFFFPGRSRGPGFVFGGPFSPRFVFAGSFAGRR